MILVCGEAFVETSAMSSHVLTELHPLLNGLVTPWIPVPDCRLKSMYGDDESLSSLY